MHGPEPMNAYQTVGVKCLTFPPYSPDLNPIENLWSLLDRRLEVTKPRGWEREKAFRRCPERSHVVEFAAADAQEDGVLNAAPGGVPAHGEGGDVAVLRRGG